MYFKSYRLFRLRPGRQNEEVCGRVQACAKWMGVNFDDAVDGPWHCFKWYKKQKKKKPEEVSEQPDDGKEEL